MKNKIESFIEYDDFWRMKERVKKFFRDKKGIKVTGIAMTYNLNSFYVLITYEEDE